MKIGALLWTERTSWDEVLEAAETADQSGFDSIWCSDHLFAANGNWRDSAFEAWSVLAAIAARTTRASVGLLVGNVGLRNPGLIAKQAVTLDHISRGRFVLGLGGGWLEREYTAHGYDWYDSAGVRIERLGEAVPVIRALTSGQEVTHAGVHYRMQGAVHAPRPIQGRLPILIGGEGRRRLLRIVASQADMWNARGDTTTLRDLDAVLRRHCEDVGRDTTEIERLANRWVVVRDSLAGAESALRASLGRHGVDVYDERVCALGNVDAVTDALAPVVAAGFRHVIWSFRSPFDYQTIGAVETVRASIEGRE